MYFLDLRGLVGTLSRRRLTPRESFRYAFGLVVLNSVTGFYRVGNPTGSAALGWFAVSLAVGLGIGFLILDWYYRANGGDDGEDFLPKLAALVFVASLRAYVVLGPIGVLIALSAVFGSAGVFTLAASAGSLVALALLLYSIRIPAQALREIHQARSAGPAGT